MKNLTDLVKFILVYKVMSVNLERGIGSFVYLGVAPECAANKRVNERWRLHCPAAFRINVLPLVCIQKKAITFPKRETGELKRFVGINTR